MTPRPAIAVTVGDPSGIGPEIAVKASRDARVTAACRPVIYGPHTPEDLASFPVGVVDPRSGQRAYEEILRAVEDARAGGQAVGLQAGLERHDACSRGGR